jgi:hypothetical protein
MGKVELSRSTMTRGDQEIAVRFLTGWAKDIPILNNIQTGPGAHKASYSVVIDGFPPLVQRPKNEADHSPPFSAEVKDEWRSPPPVNMPSWNVQGQLRCTFQIMRCRSTQQLNPNRMHSAEQVQVYCIDYSLRSLEDSCLH